MRLLDSLEPIDLSGMVAEAALLTRVDRKYLVRTELLPDLAGGLPRGSRVLEIEGHRAMGYRSTYLDTPELSSFFAAGRGRRNRWKVRVRTYLDTGTSYVEVKTRGPRGTTVKNRVELPAGPDTAVRAYAATLIDHDEAARLRPTLDTSYLRSTLLVPGGTRATIDTGLTVNSHLADREGVLEGLAVVETKSGSTPGAVDRLLWRLGQRPVRISKYGAGLAALHPELPRLKWHRVLDHHLGLPCRAASLRAA
ncbi:polyphosphate polymerase domain-containing protein [Nocardioides insulae]|uniref:polyphosphate polymerase domain-containing protein n=1 Tax=Nocardioides insulae TaxID=394734 RepID=UPI0003F8E600|nr:polyphosphate polymerase domain-containing protein [Nocardioides insulae]